MAKRIRIADPEAIAHAEKRLGEVQSVLDEVRHILRAAEHIERAADKGIKVARPIAVATAGGLALVVLVTSVRRRARRASHGQTAEASSPTSSPGGLADEARPGA